MIGSMNLLRQLATDRGDRVAHVLRGLVDRLLEDERDDDLSEAVASSSS